MRWLQTYKDHIASIGAIATALGVIAALFFSINSLILKPQKPKIDLLKAKISEQEERLVIYNGGTGPCVELSIEFPDKFIDVAQIVNYEISWHTNMAYK
jgi:hypothetical protein